VNDTETGKVKGFFLKHAMQHAIIPELISTDHALPGSLRYWKQHGIDIIIAADGTAVVRINGQSYKLEIGAAKIIVPSAKNSAQQSAFFGIPLFIHD
jgi:mannose-6-phosphate isomerase class I